MGSGKDGGSRMVEATSELLADIISEYAPQFGRGMTRKVALKLALSSAEAKIEQIRGCTYALAKTAFSECGTILEEREGDNILAGVVMAGFSNLNPCFVLLQAADGCVHIKASAKEGLIKQNTAQQAIAALQDALIRAGADGK